jgi:hypothetical protein
MAIQPLLGVKTMPSFYRHIERKERISIKRESNKVVVINMLDRPFFRNYLGNIVPQSRILRKHRFNALYRAVGV